MSGGAEAFFEGAGSKPQPETEPALLQTEPEPEYKQNRKPQNLKNRKPVKPKTCQTGNRTGNRNIYHHKVSNMVPHLVGVQFPVPEPRFILRGNFVWSKCGQSVVVKSLEKHSKTSRKSTKRERVRSGAGSGRIRPVPASSSQFWQDPAGSGPGLSFVDFNRFFECFSRLLTTTFDHTLTIRSFHAR